MTKDQINKTCALFCGLNEDRHNTYFDFSLARLIGGRFGIGVTNNPTMWRPFKQFVYDKYDGEKNPGNKGTVIEYLFIPEDREIYLVNNFHKLFPDYLRYALDNGLHPELFKMECPNCTDGKTWPNGAGTSSINCSECNSGYIDTPLARAVKEAKP